MLETMAALCVVVGAILLLREVVVRVGAGPFGRRGDARIRVVDPLIRLHLDASTRKESAQRLLARVSSFG